jgi:hypothetical protein
MTKQVKYLDLYSEVSGSNLGYGYSDSFVVMNSLGDVLKINYEIFISLLSAHKSNIGLTEKKWPVSHKT